ncbi:MAG: hypothetical protein IJ529_01155 [Alphaproteobacteria bacterium]|nr:hypothetical protein [Alphaproteobacteria bacterium]MBQ9234901.1 hypothetical protein [Alphaproteobacteria bacterium]
MDSGEETEKNEKNKLKKKNTAQIKQVGGLKGWLLRKAKTFMWDANSNTLVLPEGVALTIEERADLEAMFGEIKDQAKVVAKHREQAAAAQQMAGVKFRADVVRGYSLLINGTYRELTGILARKIHDNLQGMLMMNNRFLKEVWTSLSKGTDNGMNNASTKGLNNLRGRGGR